MLYIFIALLIIALITVLYHAEPRSRYLSSKNALAEVFTLEDLKKLKPTIFSKRVVTSIRLADTATYDLFVAELYRLSEVYDREPYKSDRRSTLRVVIDITKKMKSNSDLAPSLSSGTQSAIDVNQLTSIVESLRTLSVSEEELETLVICCQSIESSPIVVHSYKKSFATFAGSLFSKKQAC
ncbi:hypothetical protein LMH73_013865 [Vibrio splendidus]|nr:hypothetical protein [Vibrio splendidus]MCC4883062.1 hypothetical protein [Vibrio splendidus]